MAFVNIGALCDLAEVIAGQAGVNRSKIPRKLLWDVCNLKGIEAARRAGILDQTATITTVADQALYEKPDGMLTIKEVHVDDEIAYKITRDEVIRLQNLIATGSTTESTTTYWHWYIENVGVRGYIGIVDQRGNAPTTAGLEVEVHASVFPEQIESDNDVIGIPEQFFMPYAQAIAAEIMKMNGRFDQLVVSYERLWETTIYEMRHWAVENADQPMVQAPLDLSCE